MRNFAALALMACNLALAAPPEGKVDPEFGLAGWNTQGFDQGGGNEDLGLVVVNDAQGRLYQIGFAERTGVPLGCLAIARFTPDGVLDEQHYGAGGKICHTSLVEQGSTLLPTDALVQANGKLVVAGYEADTFWPFVCRFTAAGALDVAGFGSPATPGCATFDDITLTDGAPSGAPEYALDLVSLTSRAENIIVTMNTSATSASTISIARLDANGAQITYDQSATKTVLYSAGATLYLADTLLLNDGGLVIAGAVGGDSSDTFMTVVDPDTGTPDESFNDNNVLIFGSNARDIPIALDTTQTGDIIVGGVAGTSLDGMRPSITVIQPSGKNQPSFNNGDTAVYDPCVFYAGDCSVFLTGLIRLPGGGILIAGYNSMDDFESAFTMRLLGNGVQDASYGTNFPGQSGYVAIPGETSQYITGLLMQGRKPILAGWRYSAGANGNDFLITRLSDGALFSNGFEKPN